MNFIRWCINNPVSVNLLIIFMILAGMFALNDIKREIFPAFSLDRIMISILFPGATPEETEEGICIKIEEALSGLPGIKTVTSTARESMGIVIAEIETDENINLMKDEIETRINGINTFPRDAEKPIVKKLEMIGQVLHLTVSGDVPEETLRNLCEDIRKDLLTFPDISQIMLNGLKEYEISIELSEARMREYGIGFPEVAEAIKGDSLDLSAGIIRSSKAEILLRVKGQKYVRKDFENIVIRTSPEGATVFLYQIADVHDRFADSSLEGFFEGKRAGMISVFKTEDEDVIKISDQVHQYLVKKRKFLPESITLTVMADTSDSVKSRLNLLKGNGAQGLILVSICLWLFLNFQLSFWVAVGIPISMLGTFILLNIMDQTLNMLSMFGLIMSLGMIVDDAIVISESVFSKMEEDPNISPPEAALSGTARVFWPVLASISTTIVAFLPLRFMTGIMGKFIAILPVTVISCLLVSLIEALIGLPNHLAHHLSPPRTAKKYAIRIWLERQIGRLINFYGKVLKIAVEFRYATLGLAILILFFSIGMVKAGWIKFVVFPRGDSDSVKAQVQFPEGSSFENTTNTVKILAQSLERTRADFTEKKGLKEDLVRHSYALSGQHSGRESSFGTSLGEVMVELLPSEKRSVSSTQFLNRWRELTPPIPGVKSLLFTSQDRGPGGKPVEIQLRGQDFGVLQLAAIDLKNKLRTYPGIFDVEDDFKSGLTEIRLKLKPEARHLGISLRDLASQVRYGFYGNEALRIQRGRFDVKVFLRFPETNRRNLATLEQMVIRKPDGSEIPLSAVAQIVKTEGTSLIKRVEGYRIITVSSDLDETKANSNQIISELVSTGFLGELEKKYRIKYALEGQKKETMESVKGLLRGFMLSFVGIYIILATIFGSYVQPVIIMVAIPFGIIGALFGHLIMGFPITMLSIFGLVALSGIVVNNSLLIIDFINTALRSGLCVQDAVIEAGKKRIRPILLTSLTTIFGISTIMFEKSFQAQFLIPMAISIAWGLLFSTCLSLFLVPALYSISIDFLRVMLRVWEGRWLEDQELISGSDLAIPDRGE